MEVFENLVRGGVMFLRRMVVELRDLRYRVCEIGTSAEHCIHEATDFRLVDLTVNRQFFLLVELDEFNSMRDRDGCWFGIKHLKLLKNHVDIPVVGGILVVWLARYVTFPASSSRILQDTKVIARNERY